MKIHKSMKCAVVLFIVSSAVWADNINGVDIDFVTIGSPGNAADPFSPGGNDGNVGMTYKIGTYEVTIAQFAASGVGNGNEGFWSGIGSSAPAVNLTWHEAAKYCNWLTTSNQNLGAYTIVGGLVTGVDRNSAITAYGTAYVLPTADEFHKAAFYDTGPGSYTSYANGTGTAPVAGTDANYSFASSSNAWLVGTGTVEQNGTYDMNGNVWEWLESLPTDNNPIERSIKGGGYGNTSGALKNIASRPGINIATESDGIGFRVVAIPEPGTMSLLSLSTISLFITRSVRRRKRLGMSLLPIRKEHLCDAYSTIEELEAAYDESQEDSDYLEVSKQIILPYLSLAWVRMSECCKTLDTIFWGRMVGWHERSTERKKAFKLATKKKALDCFDAFLARIMK